jgi:hypothetical protein
MKCYKRFKGITFGDYFMGVVSKALDRWYKENNVQDAREIKTAVSVNTRNFPVSYDTMILGNYLTVLR